MVRWDGTPEQHHVGAKTDAKTHRDLPGLRLMQKKQEMKAGETRR